MNALEGIAKRMAERIRLWQKIQQHERECENTHITLHVGELFEQADLQVLQDYEAYLVERSGLQPLGLE